mgnify:CR=1 FL=1
MENKNQNYENACFAESLQINLEKIKVLSETVSENLFGQNLQKYSLKERLDWFKCQEENNILLFDILQDYIFDTIEQLDGFQIRQRREVQENENPQI